MRTNRQDAWTKEEDELLANTVIDYIKKGYTQLESFRHVAEQLNRTAAACGFRWNATIRKRYTQAIEAAKQERKKFQYRSLDERNNQFNQTQLNSNSTLDQAIQWLEKFKHESTNQSIHENHKIKDNIIEENKRLSQELAIYQAVIKNMKEQIEAIDVP